MERVHPKRTGTQSKLFGAGIRLDGGRQPSVLGEAYHLDHSAVTAG